MTEPRRQGPKPGAALMMLLMVGLAIYAMVDLLRRDMTEFSLPKAAVAPASAPRLPTPGPSVTSGQKVPALRQVSEEPQADRWSAFREKFGRSLEPLYTPAGRLASIRHVGSDLAPASGSYDSQDPHQVAERAKEIAVAASSLLGLEPSLPLGEPLARGGRLSGQADFRETAGGMPLAPEGEVHVNLGPNGELYDLSSTYLPGVNVGPGTTLADASLREAAAQAMGGADDVEGGTQVVWVTQASSGAIEGRPARVYGVQGRQVVVDAATGRTLSRREARTF